jgi:hypothetical protein
MGDTLRCIVWAGVWLVFTGLAEAGAEASGWPFVGQKMRDLYYMAAGGLLVRYMIWPEKFKP